MSRDIVRGLVSVVVASYNHARYLARRMESLIGQTYPEFEILAIDDCSPDNSVEILRGFAAHPRVKLTLREENGGWVAVSNQGIRLSRGEFVMFANCDDDCDGRLLERLVDALRRNPSAGMAFCRSLLVDEQDRVIGDDFTIREYSFRKRCVADTLLSKEDASRFLLHSCVIPNLSGALFRRECFENVGYLSSDYRVCSDWDLFFRIATRYDIAYVAEPLNRFRQHQTTIRSATKERVVYEEYFRLLLGQIRMLDLSTLERMKYRTHVMYLWAVHLSLPSMKGLTNIPYHLQQIIRMDWVALLFVVPGGLLRIGEVTAKFPRKLAAWISTRPNASGT